MNGSELLRQYLEFLQEGRNVDYKESTAWNDNEFKAKITKSILGFSNVRDGGVIIFGVKEQADGSFTKEGVSKEHYDTYNFDDLTSHISNFADPYVRLELYKEELEGGNYILIRIFEFDELPVICKRAYTPASGAILRCGAIYTRSYGKPQTIEVPSQTEMREILDMATEKKVRKFIETSERVGMELRQQEIEITDRSKFEEQIKEFSNDE